jgi:hypothetical protein
MSFLSKRIINTGNNNVNVGGNINGSIIPGSNTIISNINNQNTISNPNNIINLGNVQGTNILYSNITISNTTVLGSVSGNIVGNIYGNIFGNIQQDIYGGLYGNINGTSYQNINGDLNGNINGNVIGNVRLDVFGNVISNIIGSANIKVNNDLNGNMIGNIISNINGNLFGSIIGNVIGDTNLNLYGDYYGNTIGNIIAQINGDFNGNLVGNINQNIIGNILGDVVGNIIGNINILNGNLSASQSNLVLYGITSTILTSNIFNFDSSNVTNLDGIYDFKINGFTHIGIDNAYTPEKYSILTITTPENEQNEVQAISLVRDNSYTWYIGYKNNENGLYIHDGNLGIHLAPNSTSFSSTSDRRLKKNIKYIENSLEKIDKINGVYFNYNHDTDNDKRRIGVIAQEINEVLPEAIEWNDVQDVMSVRYVEIIPLLINCVKELKEELNILKNRNI